MRIPLAGADISPADLDAVAGVMRSGRLSRGGRQVAFERAFGARVGTAHAVAVSSGTAALHLAIRACGVSAGDEVITTPFSFIATANAVLYERAVPVFVDIDSSTLNIDPSRIEAAITPRTRAILVVHVFGRPADMDRILEIARRRDLPVIEDAAEALGAEVGESPVGSLGRCGTFGFYPNKPITTGEGGMLTTNDAALAALCRSVRNHGRDEASEAAEPNRLGYNYRLSEIACALGESQLRRMDEMLARRREIAAEYDRRLSGTDAFVLPPLEHAGGRTSWFVYVVRLSSEFSRDDRDAVWRAMQAGGIGCGRYFTPLHLHPHVARASGARRGDFPNAEAAADRTLALPFYGGITGAELDEVCDTLVRLAEARKMARPLP